MTSFGYSNPINDLPPPSYKQVFQLNDIATAPLLHETLPGSIFGTATTVTFEWDSGSIPYYTFIIRDIAGCVQAKGNVVDLSTTLQNINGIEMLNIIEREFGEQTNSNIFRDRSSSSPLCNIQIQNVDAYVADEFGGSIIFHQETEITTKEQLLFTAAAIAFKATMKKVTEKEHYEYRSRVRCWSCFWLIILIVLGVLAFYAMEKWLCNRKKQEGWASYRNRQC